MPQQNRRDNILLHWAEAIVFPISFEDILDGHVDFGIRNYDFGFGQYYTKFMSKFVKTIVYANLTNQGEITSIY